MSREKDKNSIRSQPPLALREKQVGDVVGALAVEAGVVIRVARAYVGLVEFFYGFVFGAVEVFHH